MLDSLTDNAVMARVRDGEVERLGLLFERYSAPLFNFFLRMTSNKEASEDLVQEVFFRLLKFRHTFREGSEFPTWLYRIARNAHIDSLRKRRPETQVEDQQQLESLAAAQVNPDPEGELQLLEDTSLLMKALDQLPAEKKELVVLSRLQQLKHAHIAQILDCSAGSVRVRLHRALADLRGAFFRLAQERAR